MSTVPAFTFSGSATAEPSGIRMIRFSPDGMRVALADTAHGVRIVEPDGSERQFELLSPDSSQHPVDSIHELVFSPSGRVLYVAHGAALLALEVSSGRRLWSYQPANVLAFLRATPHSVVVAADGSLISALDSGRLVRFGEPSRAPIVRSDPHPPLHLDLLPGGLEAVGVGGFSLTRWNLADLRRTERLVSREKLLGVSAAQTVPLVATRSLHHVSLWDLGARTVVHRIPVGIGLPVLHYCPTRNEIAVGGEHEVTLHSPHGTPRVAEVGASRVLSLRYSPDGSRLLVGCSDGSVASFSVG